MHQSIILCCFIICGLIFGTSALEQPGCGVTKGDYSDISRNRFRILGGSEAQYSIYYRVRLLYASITVQYYSGISMDDVNFTQTAYKMVRCLVQLVVHPQYTGPSTVNDVALIRMHKHIQLGDNSPFVPICLPHPQDEFYDKIIAAGWGQTSPACGYSYSEKLLKVSLMSVSDEKCQSLLENPFYNVYLCTFDPEHKKGVWEGDSGGPAMCIHKKTRLIYICGVASMAHRDGLVVYTRVAGYLPWIEATVAQNWTTRRHYRKRFRSGHKNF